MSLGGLVTSNGSQILEHSIKQAVVGLIPLKLHSKCFWKKENLVKMKKEQSEIIYFKLSNYAMRMICQVSEKQCSNELIFNPLESDLVVQPPSPLEFPGPLTPPPPPNPLEFPFPSVVRVWIFSGTTQW